jgi:hypothetical protein
MFEQGSFLALTDAVETVQEQPSMRGFRCASECASGAIRFDPRGVTPLGPSPGNLHARRVAVVDIKRRHFLQGALAAPFAVAAAPVLAN